MQFFGFKNLLVQRLLRELVANVNGTAERSLFSSSFRNEASRTEHDSPRSEACTFPNLLPYLARPQNTGKRSRKREVISTKSVNGARLKRTRPQDLVHNADASRLIQENERNDNHECSMPAPASEEAYDICKHPGALPASVHLISGTGEEKSHLSVKDAMPLNSVDFSDHLREEAVPDQEERELDGYENCISAEAANNLPAEEKPVSSSQFYFLFFSWISNRNVITKMG